MTALMFLWILLFVNLVIYKPVSSGWNPLELIGGQKLLPTTISVSCSYHGKMSICWKETAVSVTCWGMCTCHLNTPIEKVINCKWNIINFLAVLFSSFTEFQDTVLFQTTLFGLLSCPPLNIFDLAISIICKVCITYRHSFTPSLYSFGMASCTHACYN